MTTIACWALLSMLKFIKCIKYDAFYIFSTNFQVQVDLIIMADYFHLIYLVKKYCFILFNQIFNQNL